MAQVWQITDDLLKFSKLSRYMVHTYVHTYMLGLGQDSKALIFKDKKQPLEILVTT